VIVPRVESHAGNQTWYADNRHQQASHPDFRFLKGRGSVQAFIPAYSACMGELIAGHTA
jgi:hypothetical protein